MTVISTLSALPFPGAGIVIDWNQAFAGHEDHVSENTEQLVHWVRNCPHRSNVHVFLGSVLHREQARRIQRTLLALGCKVTRRNGF